MAAKLEQPISPNFTRMINLLPPQYASKPTKKGIVALEFDIV